MAESYPQEGQCDGECAVTLKSKAPAFYGSTLKASTTHMKYRKRHAVIVASVVYANKRLVVVADSHSIGDRNNGNSETIGIPLALL